MLDEVAQVQAANPDFTIEEFGAASGELAVSDVFSEDLKKAETLSLPLTLIILVIAFGSLVAAGIPLLLGITGVAATFGLIAIPSQVFPMSSEISSVILLVGLAVGVDYALFYLRREREERAKGRSPEEALQIASATAGRAVLVSGLTVIAAMAGMLLTGDGTFTSFGVGTMLVVAVAMAASVTVLPAVLAALGDKVDRGRLPRLRRKSRQQPRKPKAQGRIWIAIVDRVLRRPALSLILAGGALVALALPAVGMKLEVSGPEQLPDDLPIVQTYDRIQAAFPGENVPAVVAVSADDVSSPQVAGAIDQLTSVKSDGIYADRSTVEISEDGTAARVEIPIAGSGMDAESKQALTTLRDEAVPAAFEDVDAAVYVGGDTAETVDFTNKVEERLPLVFAFVLGLAFVLMMVTFRSIVVPIKAIVLNLLSVGAAYGVLVLVFQHGVGSGLLGFDTPGFVTSWLPLFLFVILFGLSMDYHVLIVSRIREGVDRGLSTEAAVREGIAATAGTVTSAAVVMVAVFAVFASLTLIDMKEMGLGLAVAVLIDATIVRAVLLPASMKLLGKRNWYLPKALGWLPRTSHEVEPQPAR
jgi:RND superfamily putative drug exporter